MKPGEYLIDNALDLITINSDRATASVLVRHTGDRPIQVGRAGTAVRFEPGDEKLVALVAFGGNRIVYGHNGLVNGSLDDSTIKANALQKVAQK